MNRTLQVIYIGTLAGVLVLETAAQYAPPPPPAPFPGFLNEALRKNDPYMNQWDFGGSARLRYEVREGFAIPGSVGSLDFRDHGADVNNEYWLERIRYRVGYTSKWWGALVEGRSSWAQSDERFAYGNAPAVPGTRAYRGDGPESDAVDLHQAYMILGNHKEFPLSLKIGRQELSYGEERLIGAFGWNNIGRVFDAAKLRWQNPWFNADFFASRVVIPEDGRFNVNNDYDWFSGVYATSSRVPKHLVDFYLLARNASSEAIAAEPRPEFPQPSARDIYTVGFRFKSKPGELGPWDYLLDAAYQFGDFQDRRLGATSPRLDHEAYMVVAQGGYTFAQTWASPRLGLEYAFGSGDSNPTDGRHETFENLFPTNHKFYGYMDFASLQNLHNVRGIFQLKPHPRVSVALEGHGFWLADAHDNFYNVGGLPRGGVTPTPAGNGYGINPNYGHFLGTELDLIVGYAVTRFAQLEAGYGHFFVGDYIARSLSAPTHGASDANYVYLQASLNF
ncbi:MAG: alginate export family protein [Verrucomicrobiota bacterium]